MKRRATGMAAAGVWLMGAAIWIVGCDNQCGRPANAPTAEIRNTSSKTETGARLPAAHLEAPKLFADWPTKPPNFAGALVVSGEMIGYHEPCGCTIDQKGGLVRRSIFIDLLRRQGWDVGLIDLGSLIQDPAKSRDGPDQTRLKFAMTVKALQQMGYRALALSAEDLRLGTAETLMQFENLITDDTESLQVVSANATPVEGLGKVRPSLRLDVGPMKVGVTAVLDPAAFDALNDSTKSELLTVRPPEEVIPGVLADLERDTRVQVLMVQGSPELARRLAKRFPEFEIVVSTLPFSDPPDKPEVLNNGKTWLVTTGRKGMYVGVIGLYDDLEQPMRYQRVELNKRYDQYRDRASEIISLVGDEFQNTLKTVGVLQTYPRRPYAEFNTPADATFIGAEACKDCHPKTYEHWTKTKHFHGYEPLISDPRDAGRNREHDAACVSCHTVGFEFVGGFVTAKQTPELKGVQCESCHGPGSAHADDPSDAAALQAVKRSAADFHSSGRCIKCHDEDNDPHFDFDKYWPQVEHKGLDQRRKDAAR